MKTVVLILMLVMIVVTAYGETWTIEPQYHDFTPNDGFMDTGTWQNPYEIKDSTGQERGTISPRYPDFFPDDGFMDVGTTSNPYEIDWGN